MKNYIKNLIHRGTKNNLVSRKFATLIIPDIVSNNKLHSSINNLSTAASKLGEKDVI